MRNLYSDPGYAKLIATMKLELKSTRAELGETDKKYPAIQAIIDAHWH
jgi:N-acetylglucosamine-6-sulfatase